MKIHMADTHNNVTQYDCIVSDKTDTTTMMKHPLFHNSLARAIALSIFFLILNPKKCQSFEFIKTIDNASARVNGVERHHRCRGTHPQRNNPIADTTEYQQQPQSQFYPVNRRKFLVGLFSIAPLVSNTCPDKANALFETPSDRRQLEFCLVAVIRVVYFAQKLLVELKTTSASTSPDSAEQRKKLYLEAKLGAKAALTGKIGGGATGRVYTLSTLQLTGCLNDLEYYNPIAGGAKQEFREALASIVEFDGLDTLIDDSPRSSLTLQQYNPQKAVYLERILAERVIPVGQRLLRSFDAGAVERAQRYVQSYYSDEIPPT